MAKKIDWKKLAEKNIYCITAFVLRLIKHNGKINSQYIYEIKIDDKCISLKHPEKIKGEYLNGGIKIPGEITNSFCTLYEIGYFANALLLNGVVSALPIKDYKEVKNEASLIKRIKKDILSLSEEEIINSVKSPKIPIISWLTDDVETYRFRKENLWGVKKEVSKKIIGEITKEDMGKEKSEEFYKQLWTDKDKEITDTAIKYAEDMCKAKMIQYYLALGEYLKLLDIQIENIPFYFFCSPYHELLVLGQDHEFLEFLIAMHNKESLKIFSKIVGQQNPILIKIPCPKCGESSKKVINGRIKGDDKRIVRLVCSEAEKTFNNEHGLNTKIVKGCGQVWEFRIPDDPKELFKLMREKGFSLHVTLTNLLQIFRTTAISPVAHVICDLNIYYENDEIKIFSPYPSGYGSSAQLFTSVMVVQLAFLNGLLAKDFFKKHRKLIVDNPFMLIAHQSPSTLYDPKDIYKDILNEFGIKAGPQDSGIFKVLEDGMSPEEIFTRSVDLTYYPAEKMMKDIRKIDLKYLEG